MDKINYNAAAMPPHPYNTIPYTPAFNLLTTGKTGQSSRTLCITHICFKNKDTYNNNWM